MESELNCSSQCDSSFCFIQSGVSREEGLDILQRLCGLSTMSVELPRRSLSPVLSAVVWTLLSCGILLALCFLCFTLRFKNNRIVKMSSPNLNILTLAGSVLTYSSGFLFAVSEHRFSKEGAPTAALQARMWTLCIGSTLVFGPILGKTWRLYRVFTQRVPDKRVIIRDIQLMGLVALLILVDVLILTTWYLTDPVRCSRSAGAVVKVMERDVSYSLLQLDTCSSLYSDLWLMIIGVQKGCLLLYGTYLAGLTYNVSHPPVNQSPTILTVVTLVTISSAVAVPISIFLQAWPNLVYSAVAGAIFICTIATNCMLFVPQLTQWRHFEEDQNNPSQMAKYFSSPSKSQPSIYSQDEIYYLLGENNSMKKLLNEKNAVIDSLQEQVSNAKDKLLRLMSASQPSEEQDLASSNTNLNSSSTQTTEVQSDGPSVSSLPQRDSKPPTSPLSPPTPLAAAAGSVSPTAVKPPSEPPSARSSVNPIGASSPVACDIHACENQRAAPASRDAETRTEAQSRTAETPTTLPGVLRTAEETVRFVTSLQARRGLLPFKLETLGDQRRPTNHVGPNSRPPGFVSSEQLQEIVQELSVDAVENTLRSPCLTSRRPSQVKFSEASAFSPLSLRTPRSPHPPPVLFRFPSISPYAMRKRRPPFYPSRGGLPCFYTGAEPAHCARIRNKCGHSNAGKAPGREVLGGRLIRAFNNDCELEEEEEEDGQKGEEGEEGPEGSKEIRECRRCLVRSHRCSALTYGKKGLAAAPDAQAAGECVQLGRHIRDSCGSWDSDSSSSSDYCYYHRPYCDSCMQPGSLLSSDSSSDSSDSEYEGYGGLYRSPHPVVFKEDIKPTFV